jgi:membrane protein
MTIGGVAVGPFLKQVGRNIIATDVLGYAAQTAYYFFFSLFPLFLFITPLLSLVGDKRKTVGVVLEQLAEIVPSDAYHLIAGVVNDVVFAKGAPGVISLGAILALWAGSNVFSSLTDALDHVFGRTETRSWWRTTLVACAFALGASIVGVVATVVLVDGESVVTYIANFVGLGATATLTWTILQFPLAIGFVVLLGWAIYYVLPNLRLSAGEALVGALFATGLWILVTLAFRAYVQHFGAYNKMYGTIGAVVVLLIWMYLTMLVILTAGVVAAAVHGERSGRGLSRERGPIP